MKLLQVIGIGPGKIEGMTMEAKAAIDRSDVIVGYKTYTDLLKGAYPNKEYIENGMRQEEVRCRAALDRAAAGDVVAVVCSGDAGVYGMAGLLYELSEEASYADIEIQVIAGVTAALSGAAVLGSPLGHDFCVISLSDLLTPMDKIEKRVRLAGEADLCISLYNVGSRKRRDYLRRACEILMESRPADTVCGYVRNIGREGEEAFVMTLRELTEVETDMFMTVFIGNSETRVIHGKMVTPRGYRL